MGKDRLLAFTDGVIAIIITIMVLSLEAPRGSTFAALAAVAPTFFCYVLSFVYVGIYWNNHHHFFHLVRRVNGAILWANLHLLFWLSLIPFATRWAGQSHFAAVPTAIYGVSLLMPAFAWYAMQTAIIREQGPASALRQAIGRDLKGKISPFCYLCGILAAFVDPRISDAIYVAVALMWLVPDRRIERLIGEHPARTD
ncbi:MAG: TMEM175 family protein [Acetobacteraceae bacterium]